jgi:hypothetical protein
MRNGEFDTAIKQLAQIPETRELAGQLGMFRPVADLARGSALANLESLKTVLQQLIRGAGQADAAALSFSIDSSNAHSAPQNNDWNRAIVGTFGEFEKLRNARDAQAISGAAAHMLASTGFRALREISAQANQPWVKPLEDVTYELNRLYQYGSKMVQNDTI